MWQQVEQKIKPPEDKCQDASDDGSKSCQPPPEIILNNLAVGLRHAHDRLWVGIAVRAAGRAMYLAWLEVRAAVAASGAIKGFRRHRCSTLVAAERRQAAGQQTIGCAGKKHDDDDAQTDDAPNDPAPDNTLRSKIVLHPVLLGVDVARAIDALILLRLIRVRVRLIRIRHARRTAPLAHRFLSGVVRAAGTALR